MSRAIDVAEYILEKLGPMTAMKLQKLVYYAQAWHLAWTEKPLFNEKIEAWKNGPVVVALYEMHKGCFKLNPGYFASRISPKSINPLSKDEKKIVHKIIKFYGSRDPHWLSQLTHMEDPWKNARSKSSSLDQERSSEEITHQAMFEYYCSL